MFIFGGTAGVRRTTVIGIPLNQMEGNIYVIFIITTLGAAKRTTEKLFFTVTPHRLCNSRGPPSPPPDQPSGHRRRSAPRIPSQPRHEGRPRSRLFSHVIDLIIINVAAKRMKERILYLQYRRPPPQPLPRKGNRGYSSSVARLKQASKGPHELAPQPASSSEALCNAPHGGSSLE